MNSTELWQKVGHLFHTDDGSLPDIFIDNLSNEEIVTIYDYVMTQSEMDGDPTAWSLESEKDVPIRDIDHPAKQFIEKRIESFRHRIALRIAEIELPSLSICVAQESIEFDYRKGKEWNKDNVNAIFRFLSEIQSLDGLTAVRDLEKTVWTIQHWNGTIVNIPKTMLSDDTLDFLRDWVRRANDERDKLGIRSPYPTKSTKAQQAAS